jgi:hypothetical protein
MNLTWKVVLFLLLLSGCVSTKPVVNNGLVELSKEGDYIRPIKTSNGYYYNNPRGGKLVHSKQ